MTRLSVDSRWVGPHGIGRFAQEVLARLPGKPLRSPFSPLSPLDPLALSAALWLRRPAVFFSPGFNPPLWSPVPFVFTIHDLIHLHVPEELSRLKAAYYRFVVRPAARRAFRVLTVSEYSKTQIVRWAGVKPDQVVVVGNGVDLAFSPDGPAYDPGYPYILYVGNRKPHKNLPRLLEAFAQVAAEQPELHLLLSGAPDDETRHQALRLGIYHRVVFAGHIPEAQLPALYRGAALLTLPSLYEGFGLPPLEAMACGTPVVVSDTTSLPEVVGEAGVLVDPQSVPSIADGLRRALTDSDLRERLRAAGLERARQFSWDRVAERVRRVLAEAEAA